MRSWIQLHRTCDLLRLPALVLAAATVVSTAEGAPLLTVSGYLNDPANPALVGSGLAPDAPLFADDWEIANNVAVYPFSLAAPATVTFDSNGYAAGGVDPYFTLFQGSTAATATFVESNYLQAFWGGGGDFLISLPLLAGDYFVAIGAFANESFAENWGGIVLADGFIGLGQPDLLGSYYYELVLTTDVTPVPEPSSLVLITLGLCAAGARGVSHWRQSSRRT